MYAIKHDATLYKKDSAKLQSSKHRSKSAYTENYWNLNRMFVQH